MALSWILRDGEVTSVLIGASRPSQITENIQIIHKIDFTKDELKKSMKSAGCKTEHLHKMEYKTPPGRHNRP